MADTQAWARAFAHLGTLVMDVAVDEGSAVTVTVRRLTGKDFLFVRGALYDTFAEYLKVNRLVAPVRFQIRMDPDEPLVPPWLSAARTVCLKRIYVPLPTVDLHVGFGVWMERMRTAYATHLRDTLTAAVRAYPWKAASEMLVRVEEVVARYTVSPTVLVTSSEILVDDILDSPFAILPEAEVKRLAAVLGVADDSPAFAWNLYTRTYRTVFHADVTQVTPAVYVLFDHLFAALDDEALLCEEDFASFDM